MQLMMMMMMMMMMMTAQLQRERNQGGEVTRNDEPPNRNASGEARGGIMVM
jgi:hypothetical protein